MFQYALQDIHEGCMCVVCASKRNDNTMHPFQGSIPMGVNVFSKLSDQMLLLLMQCPPPMHVSTEVLCAIPVRAAGMFRSEWTAHPCEQGLCKRVCRFWYVCSSWVAEIERALNCTGARWKCTVFCLGQLCFGFLDVFDWCQNLLADTGSTHVLCPLKHSGQSSCIAAVPATLVAESQGSSPPAILALGLLGPVHVQEGVTRDRGFCCPVSFPG
jgi:hypothetical protein